MEHIQTKFKENIQYVCISSPAGQPTCPPVLYIQIVLKEMVKQKSYFLKTVAGLNELYFNSHSNNMCLWSITSR